MTWALVILALGGNATAVATIVLAHRERKQLFAAVLQVHGRGDAARRLAPVGTPPPTPKEAVEMQKEIMENGGVFSAGNPFGSRPPEGKPLGV